MRLRFRTIAHKTNLNGLKQARPILQRNMRLGLTRIGGLFQKGAVSRMRKDTGESIKSLQIVVRGKGLDLGVLVFSEKIQALIDAQGLPRGIFPPFGEGTPLYRWAQRKIRSNPSKRVKLGAVPKRSLFQLNKNYLRRQRLRNVTKVKKVRVGRRRRSEQVTGLDNQGKRLAFIVARVIYRKGIRATHWNTKALQANKNKAIAYISYAIQRSITEMRRM